METRSGPITVTHSARGNATYKQELWHDGLKKHRVIKADSEYLVMQKARLQIAEWTDRWEQAEAKEQALLSKAEGKRHQEQRKQEALELSAAASEELEALAQLLQATLAVDDRVDWESLKDRSEYPEHPPSAEKTPEAPVAPKPPAKPRAADYQPKLGILDKLISSRKQRLMTAARERYDADVLKWEQSCAALAEAHQKATDQHAQVVSRATARYLTSLEAWKERKAAFLAEQAEGHKLVDQKREAYERRDASAICDYCEIVLSASDYPDYFPQEFELDYDSAAQTLIVDYQLPAPEDLPTLKSVRYVAARDALEESHISEPQKLKLYDDVLYQTVLRTLHELFEADTVDALAAVVVNGIVTATDKTTGNEVTSCVLSVRATKQEFESINLAAVEPKSCFKALKGVGSAKLSGLSAVAPVMKMRRDDGRFISSYEVANTLDEGVNLASMDWEDFEHLIREIFEKEFSSTGGEVKVTQASRDGGVDAVAFDPDPIRGGKIVIQAKRWTNTVGVAAVRDLFGTVMAEGATKGVLVTTSDYGADSYSFASGKPLVLLNGANLLHMLAKHGHKARIDIREARRNLIAGGT